MELLILFIILNIANVVIQTVKSIATIKCGKTAAALVNAVAYGLYTFVLIFTNSNLNMWVKAIVVALTNLVGVYVVKLIEEKAQKDKLWKVTTTIPKANAINAKADLKGQNISCSCIELEHYIIFDCYCNKKQETSIVKEVCKKYNGKMFATESKIL